MNYERDNVRNLSAYQWGEQPTSDQVLKLNTNESPYPPSPLVQRALTEFSTDQLRRYPQPTADGLRRKLAALHEIESENIVVTHGGDEGLRLALTTFVEPGSSFGMLDPSYSLYEVLALVQGARVLKVPLGDSWEVPRNFAQELNEAGVNLACIVNPHAPSGTLIDAERIGRLANEFNGVLLVDEAYVDFVDPALRYDLVPLISAFDNLLILRTFSKGYGLAGLRLGYLMGAPGLIAPVLGKTRDSYNIDAISQALGEAAISDQLYAKETWHRVRQARRQLRDALIALRFQVPISQTNFLLAEVPMDFVLSASEIYQALKSRSILVRYFGNAQLEDKLRITVGTEAQNLHLIQTLTSLLESDE